MADDLYDFLADPSDSARGRRLADALRRTRGGADLLQATGDKQLGGLAAQQYRAADEGEQAVRQAVSGRLTRSMEAQRLASEEKRAAQSAKVREDAIAEKASYTEWLRQQQATKAAARPLGRALAAGRGGAPALGPDGQPVKSYQERRLALAQGKYDNATGPLEGYEVIDAKRPAFRDADVAHQVGKAQTADSQLDTHAKDALEGYDEYLKAPTGTDAWVKSKNRVTNALVNMTSKLVLAEGKPLTEGSEQAIAATLGLRKDEHGGWSFIGPESMWTKDAVADRVKNALASGHANFGVLIGTTNQRRRAAQAAAVPMSAPHPQDSASADAQAIAWAKANPNDPDAQEILRLHGM